MQQKFTQNYPPFKLIYLCIFGPLLAWLDRMHHGNQTCAESKHQLQYQAHFTLVSRIIAGDLSRISRTQRLNSLFLVSTTGRKCACLFEFHGHETIPTWSAVTCMPELYFWTCWRRSSEHHWLVLSESRVQTQNRRGPGRTPSQGNYIEGKINQI